MNDLVEVAILAYRSEKYRDAMELLLQAAEKEPTNWMAKLYLGLSYQKLTRTADAQRLFKRLTEECTDVDVRRRAVDALLQAEADMRAQFSPSTIKALTAGKKNVEDKQDEKAANW